MSLLEMSLRGGILILVIALVRALTLHYLPKRTFLLLWALAAARLTLPVSLPARFSVYTLVTQLASVSTGKMISGTPLTGTTHFPGTVSLPENAGGALPLPVVAASSGVSVWTILWLAGAVLCAALLLLAYGKCRREFRTSLPVENDAVKQWLCAHPLRREIQVRQSELVSAPLTYGIFRPVILLPKTMDFGNVSALSYVLEHEYIHIRRLDALTKPLMLAIFCVHWFNPAVWLMVLLANRDLELSCDEALLRRRGLDAKAEYAKALLSLEVQRSKFTPFYSSFSKNAMEERMKAMLKMKKSTRFAAVLACVLVLVIAAGFCTSALSVTASTDGQPEIYENAALGFRLRLPADWAGQYIVEPHPTSENAVVFCTKATEEPGWRTEDFWGGTLCYIFKTPMEEWIAGGRGADAPTAFRVLGETDAYVYRMVFPGDVNYDPENQAQTQRYEEMWDTLYSGDLAFEILDSPTQLVLEKPFM